MSTDITLSLPDTICQTAQVWATQAGRTLPDFLAEAIEASLVPLGNAPHALQSWTNEELNAAADAALPADADRRLSELLSLQREGTIDGNDRGELAQLMQAYQEGLVRKAAALREAVRRGLRGPLAP